MSDLVTSVWDVDAADFPWSGTFEERATFLLHYAILAPSSHNTQPWRFSVGTDHVDVAADPDGWLPVADADRRELHLSVGCAVENLVVAAEHFGFAPVVEQVDAPDDPHRLVRVRLPAAGEGDAPTRPPELFSAIPRRHTNHQEYDGRPVPPALRARLEALASEADVEIHFTDDADVRRRVDDLTLQADALQFADPAWRHELGEWLGRGVFGHGWLVSKLVRFAVSHLDLAGSTGKKDLELLRSAPLLGLVSVRAVDRAAQVRAGQVFERLFLAATDQGLALQPMNQVLQVPDVRAAFHDLLPAAWGTPQITFRIGYAPPEDHTPRKPLVRML